MKKLAAISAFIAGLFLIAFSQYETKQEAFALSTLKIVTENGHGSGVHIGNGYVLTAAHVIRDADSVKVTASHGGQEPADVLWTNKAYDVALLHADHLIGVAASPLSCRQTGVGQSVKATGNPGPLEFVSSWGRVSSSELKRGPWGSTIIIDVTIAPGSSGGPVFDVKGNVVAIIVGVAMMSDGFNRSAIPLSYAVPATAVCKMLARNSS